MISGLSHLTFIVRDPVKSAGLFIRVFGAREVYDSGKDSHSVSREKFLLVGDVWIALMQGESLQARTYDHVAFRISDDSYDLYLSRIRDLGLEVLPGRSRISGEGRSIYFYDYDNHLYELHTGELAARLEAYGVMAHGMETR